jgi:hypothetical protein
MHNIQQAMKQAQAFQNKMMEKQKEFESRTLDQQSGGGLVKVTMTLKGELKKISIDPSLLAAEEKEVLEDLIIAAINSGKTSAEQQMAEEMKEITGSLGLPPGLNLPF